MHIHFYAAESQQVLNFTYKKFLRHPKKSWSLWNPFLNSRPALNFHYFHWRLARWRWGKVGAIGHVNWMVGGKPKVLAISQKTWITNQFSFNGAANSSAHTVKGAQRAHSKGEKTRCWKRRKGKAKESGQRWRVEEVFPRTHRYSNTHSHTCIPGVNGGLGVGHFEFLMENGPPAYTFLHPPHPKSPSPHRISFPLDCSRFF